MNTQPVGRDESTEQARLRFLNESINALESAALDAALGGTGYVRVSNVGGRMTAERLEPGTVDVDPTLAPGEKAEFPEHFE